MSEHRPDYDRLSAYIEGSLSIDGMQWVDLHLKSCELCRDAVERERRFLQQLGRLRGINPPPDFVEAVMARVAQYPAHRPATEVPWRKVAVGGGALAAALVVLVGLGAWQAISQGALASAGASGLLYEGIRSVVTYGGFLFSFVAQVLDPAMALARAIATAVVQLFVFAANASWMVQLGLLLITVTLNYVFTRMVLNYQRRR